MKAFNKYALCLLVLLSACAGLNSKSEVGSQDKEKDRYLWLEEVEGKAALDWVNKKNENIKDKLEADPLYSDAFKKMSDLVNAKDRLPIASWFDGYLYLFWQDATNVRGVLKRTTLEEYLKPQIKWDVIINFDELAKTEKENWVYKGYECNLDFKTRCLINLSRGGKDAMVVREFDLNTRQFVADGFYMPEAKGNLNWLTADSVLVTTDFGAGSLTTSGYPRMVKVWKRGEKLEAATMIYEAQTTDVSASANKEYGDKYVFVTRGITFYTSENFVYEDVSLKNKIKIPLPEDADLHGVYKDQLLFMLRSDWTFTKDSQSQTFKSGELLSLSLVDLFANKKIMSVEKIFSPNAKQAFESLSVTSNGLLLTYLENVSAAVNVYTRVGSGWQSQKLRLPKNGSINVVTADKFWPMAMLTFENFIEPTQLLKFDGATDKIKKIKTLPARFDAKNLQVKQYFATSVDKTKIPYYLIANKKLVKDGQNKTIMYGYGGFENSMNPYYSGAVGQLWLEKGNVYVMTNIRGGGEFGPAWHKAAILENKQKSYDDFIAIAEDLIAKGITDSQHLAIEGGSNGGLLMGAVTMQRPELFKAVICQVPLLDMIRYPLLGAGASWMGEYGDPSDAKMREVILRYSPYQNVRKNMKYPRIFFLTSTKDDRVHPAHARKMAAKLEDEGYPVYYFENTEGGHGAAANRLQTAKRIALEFTYLYREL